MQVRAAYPASLHPQPHLIVARQWIGQCLERQWLADLAQHHGAHDSFLDLNERIIAPAGIRPD
jgi:hypothetical protein